MTWIKTYEISTATLNGVIDAGSLHDEIVAASLTDFIGTRPGASGFISIEFAAQISGGEETTLDGVLAAHTGVEPTVRGESVESAWAACRAITTTNISNLSGGTPSTVDGISLAQFDRVLVNSQDTGSQNGIYQVSAVGTGSNGTWTRVADASLDIDFISGKLVAVSEGTLFSNTLWQLSTNNPITVDTTALTFTQASALAVISAYDSTGGQSFSGTTTTINYDATHVTSGVFDLTSDVITINVSGVYSFSVQVSCGQSSNNRGDYLCYVEEDPLGVGSFAEIPGTRAWMYTRNNASDDGTAAISFVLSVSATDQFRVRAVGNSGGETHVTKQDGSRFTIIKIG